MSEVILQKMPSVLTMVAQVAIVVTIMKLAAAKVNLLLKGVWALGAAVLASIGVWYYHISISETAITVATIIILLEIVSGATIGYKFLPDSIKDFKIKNLKGEVLNHKVDY